MSDFVVVVRVRNLAGTLLFDLHDHANGYEVLSPLSMPEEAWRRLVTTSPYVDGSAETTAALDAGRLEVQMKITGSSWAQVETRRLAARASWINMPSFLLEVNLEGVTQTFRANRPDVTSLQVEASHLLRKVRLFVLTFPVQPNPTITGV